MSSADDRETQVRIRRAPKFAVFAILGGVIGIVVAFILTASFPIDPKVGFGATFGYFAIYGVVLGVTIGCVVAVVIDRALRRRARTLRASVDRLQPPPEQ